jgi:hypothetical protein
VTVVVGDKRMIVGLICVGLVNAFIPAVVIAYIDKGVGFELCSHLSVKDIDVLEVIHVELTSDSFLTFVHPYGQTPQGGFPLGRGKWLSCMCGSLLYPIWYP